MPLKMGRRKARQMFSEDSLLNSAGCQARLQLVFCSNSTCSLIYDTLSMPPPLQRKAKKSSYKVVQEVHTGGERSLPEESNKVALLQTQNIHDTAIIITGKDTVLTTGSILKMSSVMRMVFLLSTS